MTDPRSHESIDEFDYKPTLMVISNGNSFHQMPCIDASPEIRTRLKIAVVIPSFRVTRHILGVLNGVPIDVDRVFVVDDCCPDHSGDFVEQHCKDPRVCVIRNPENQGVGGAVIAGYRAAMAKGCDIIVKVDGDGQMDPRLIPQFVEPIASGRADYSKGNRFFDLEHIQRMPTVRLVGNAGLSFFSKLSTGYWTIFDPTNGYTAIHARVAAHLPLHRVSCRYFFETDMLFRLGTLRAVVVDVPMHAVYGDEVSHLRVSKALGEFAAKHLRNMSKRIFYNYFLRDVSLASLCLVLGCLLLGFGTAFGLAHWFESVSSGVAATTGTVMLAALPALLGVQLLLQFMGHDIASTPTVALHSRLPPAAAFEGGGAPSSSGSGR